MSLNDRLGVPQGGFRWSHRRNGEPLQAMTSLLISGCEGPHCILERSLPTCSEALSSAVVCVGLRLKPFVFPL